MEYIVDTFIDIDRKSVTRTTIEKGARKDGRTQERKRIQPKEKKDYLHTEVGTIEGKEDR